MANRSIFSISGKPFAFAVIASGLFSFGCGTSIEWPVEQTVEQTYEIDSTGFFVLGSLVAMETPFVGWTRDYMAAKLFVELQGAEV